MSREDLEKISHWLLFSLAQGFLQRVEKVSEKEWLFSAYKSGRRSAFLLSLRQGCFGVYPTHRKEIKKSSLWKKKSFDGHFEYLLKKWLIGAKFKGVCLHPSDREMALVFLSSSDEAESDLSTLYLRIAWRGGHDRILELCHLESAWCQDHQGRRSHQSAESAKGYLSSTGFLRERISQSEATKIETQFSAAQMFSNLETELLRRLEKKIETQFKKKEKKIEKEISELEASLPEEAQIQKLLWEGELLKANVPQLKQALREQKVKVSLRDWSEGVEKQISCAIDSSKDLSWNLARPFQGAKRLKRKKEQDKNRIDRLHKARALFKSLESRVQSEEVFKSFQTWKSFKEDLIQSGIFSLRDLKTLKPLEETFEEPKSSYEKRGIKTKKGLHGDSLLSHSQIETFQKKGIRLYESLEGQPVFLGKHAQANDEILRLAKPFDLWFHAKGATGSHVLLRRKKNEEPTESVFREVAALALEYSALRKTRVGEVSMVERKYIKKPKGAPAGAVTYSREKIFWVDLDKKDGESLKEILQRKIRG
jgi:hypothetical protein